MGGGSDESHGTGDRARWGRRLGAWFLDQAALFVAVFVVVGVPVGAVLDEDSAGLAWALIILLYPVVLVAYFTAFHARVGQTLGKRVLGIKVVDASSSGPIGYARALRRSVVTAILWAFVVPGLIDGLRLLWNAEQQTWHDSSAGSVVIRTPEAAQARGTAAPVRSGERTLNALEEARSCLSAGRLRGALRSLERARMEAWRERDLAMLGEVVDLVGVTESAASGWRAVPVRLSARNLRALVVSNYKSLERSLRVHAAGGEGHGRSADLGQIGSTDQPLRPVRPSGFGTLLGAVAIQLGMGLFFVFAGAVGGTNVFDFDGVGRWYLVAVWSLWSLGLMLIVARWLAFRERMEELAETAAFFMGSMVFGLPLLGLVSRRVRVFAGLTLRARPEDKHADDVDEQATGSTRPTLTRARKALIALSTALIAAAASVVLFVQVNDPTTYLSLPVTEDFEAAECGWPTGESEVRRVECVDGSLLIVVKQPNWIWYLNRSLGSETEALLIETRAALASGTTSEAGFGVACSAARRGEAGIGSTGSGYAGGLEGSSATIWRFDELSEFRILANAPVTTADLNHIRLECASTGNGARLTLTVNQHEPLTALDTDGFVAFAEIGPYASSSPTAQNEIAVRFDSLNADTIPPDEKETTD